MRTNESDANKTTNTAEAPSTYPAVTFLSREELVKHLKSQYEEQGVVLTIKCSKSSRVVLKCDRGGTYKHNHSQQKRKTHTRLTGCSFEIVCSSKHGGCSAPNINRKAEDSITIRKWNTTKSYTYYFEIRKQ